MEFEQYLERDILTFLDTKIDKKENTSVDREEEYGLYLTKDYLKELNYALDNDELTRAKKLFDELKNNYSRLPKSSVERKKIYSLLEKMYEKIQNYVRIKEGKIEVIKQGDMEVFKDTTDKFSSLAERMEKGSIANAASESKKIKDLPIETKAINKSGLFSEHSKEDILGKKSHDKNKFAVESNISGSTIKDVLEKPQIFPTKDKENKEIIEETLETIDNDKILNNIVNGHLEKKHPSHVHKTHDVNREVEERKHNMHSIEHAASESSPLDWKNEIIDKTSMHLEKLKMHVTDKLLEELRKKLDENSDEQNKKIESLRKEIVKQVIEELDKKLKREKSEVSNKMEHLRGEILNKVFHQAQHIISSKDNEDNIKVEQYSISNDNADNYSASDISNTKFESVDRSDVVRFTRDASLDNFENEVDTKQIAVNKYSGEELRVVYEQAIYYMFDNKYDEAAKLFRKIITVQPKNKAAHIRLQECIEKQPELSKQPKDDESMQDSELKNIITTSKINPAESSEDNESKYNKDNSSININTFDVRDEISGDIDDFKDDMKERVDTFAEDIKKLKNYNIKHKYNDAELQKMYEEAVYTMFQNNYDDAAKIFQEILRIRPENKAARIRLQECKEAIGDA